MTERHSFKFGQVGPLCQGKREDEFGRSALQNCFTASPGYMGYARHLSSFKKALEMAN